jgi:hypothetical protein
VRLEGLDHLKNPVTSKIEPAIFRLVALVPQRSTLLGAPKYICNFINLMQCVKVLKINLRVF